MYKVYIENSAVLFAQQLPADPQGEVFRVAPGETPAITKFLQKLQFTKKLYVISENIERIFDEFRASLPFIEAAGGLVVDDAAKVLMIFRNGRWDLPKGKLEPGERIEDCAVREVSEECGLRIEELQRKEPITHTFHCYRIREQWVLKRTAWYHMRYVGGQRPQPQTVEGITRAEWIEPERVPELLSGTYYTIGDVFREAGCPVR